MIFAVGLPRSGGQSLLQALTVLTGRQFWHSISPTRWHVLEPHHGGAVEVYAPICWLEKRYPGPHQYIVNVRACQPWLASCERQWPRSQNDHWNHPLWRYHPTQMTAYRAAYEQMRKKELGDKATLWLDITQQRGYEVLAAFLRVDTPPLEWPRVDRFSTGRA